ncbi:MAG: hypothetical protein ACLQDY_19295 [Streptosporangiaceae bacterium]
MEPARYRLAARLSDMFHGWLDGRRGLPPLPTDYERPARRERPADIDAEDAPVLPALSTPRMEVLSREAAQHMEGERIRCGEECALLKREAARFLGIRDSLAAEVADTAEKLGQARTPLAAEERAARRLAERDEQSRPAELVHARRQTGWERRLTGAEQRHQSVTRRLAEASRDAQLREELIRDREAAARAAARRHHELGMRRIATYLQQLTRTHKHGAELSPLLMRTPVGPDLPEWTREPMTDQLER